MTARGLDELDVEGEWLFGTRWNRVGIETLIQVDAKPRCLSGGIGARAVDNL